MYSNSVHSVDGKGPEIAFRNHNCCLNKAVGQVCMYPAREEL